MSRYNKPVDLTWRDILAQAAVVAVAIFIIVWFLPRDERTNLHIDVGRPWLYSQFIAPFDFPIFKTDEQLKQERDSIRKLYEPYFELQEDTESEELTHFRNDFRPMTVEDLSPSYRIYIEERLHAIYGRGIISNADHQRLLEDSCRAIRIFHGTTAQAKSVSGLLSQKAAYEYLLAGTDSAELSRPKVGSLNLNRYVRPNLVFDEAKSIEQWEALENTLSPSSGMVLAGQSVIDRGEIVSEKTYQIMQSYERASSARKNTSRENHLIILGQTLCVGIILICLAVFFNLFRMDYIRNGQSITLLITLVLSFPLMASFLIRHTMLSVYIIPYTMLPIFIRVFMDSRTAFITHVATIALCSLSLRYPFEFLSTQCVAGLIAIYSLRELSERSQIIRTAILVTAVTLLFFLSIDLMHGRTPLGGDSMTTIDWSLYKHIILSGVLLLFAYPFMALLERVFGFTSNVTLVELSNINRDLLRRLSEEAPGTFQHSMQVANLAAEAARKIGAKIQLVRTGALYHDIGKLQNPAFFTENQLGGINPHQKLDARESARIIINHVIDGEQMAEKEHLPSAIIDFISTHHGHGIVKYFYVSYKNQHPREDVDPAPFTYPGRNPQTSEQAILMMADAVEASARSLKEYNEESIGELVDRIIDAQVNDGMFVESPITFLDIKTAKEVFKEKLMTIYHTRISYPMLHETNDSQSGSTSK
ncbi:MAG: HDIG domain-containing protein [Bacteroidaceae bacterium]|nr:HDIG domain-containing protein [Bacteroidaceae bacterium]